MSASSEYLEVFFKILASVELFYVYKGYKYHKIVE